MINSEEVWIGNIYRPPSEAYSIILQATIGCSHNKCTFCSMYKSKKFSIKPIEKIKNEIEYFRKRVKYAERIFLADGDAMIIPTEMLLEILAYIKKVFPECKRISSYATSKSIELKTNDELRKIRESGISLLYIGLESGDDKVLEKINKGVSSDELAALCKKAKEAGFSLSVTFIAGILGKKDWKDHAVNTGKLISRIEPDYVGILSLMLEEGTEIYTEYLKGEFQEAEGIDILKEIEKMIENINVKVPVIFRANHASNYLNLGGTFPQDKERLISQIKDALDRYDVKDKKYRRL
ncbi:radical SAM superfamily enzyme YgiQ (UPF0313 family) [Fusobacterium sp. PH5-7]|uniref:radical SAM protein n=1 Tax=Fusobacterium sp. PH5-7 TaxID=2940528 RepID=UPI002475C678|nr:radical SAM protein [Fusobacterium sp. PH5-7]MDH6457767.1 radical SAM superfamily enzyme YgiQ (UPF0313 family) [Fusobacterium sp. PH5-7]